MMQENKNKNVLKVKNLNKIFSSKGLLTVAIDDVSFELDQGETIGLIGESGSGKTTIGRSIIRLYKATSGQVLINNTDVASKKINKNEKMLLRKSIQMIFQDPYSSLNEQKNIMNIVSEPIKILKLDKKYIEDLYKDSEKIFKFFGTSLSNEYYERRYAFRKFANKTAIKAYHNIIKYLEESSLKYKTKKQMIDKLIANFYGLKEEANKKIINDLFSINSEIFDFWNKAQKKIENNQLDSPIEKETLKLLKKMENAEKNMKHTKKYLEIKDEFDKFNGNLNEYNEFHKNKIVALTCSQCRIHTFLIINYLLYYS
ncbi:MAG: ATP-binding cassette domain-containing protein [Mycoplasmatales bacterium]|nr:ATP-binding cassette domain-containing protein [Mycoplasmatales bacterium]